MARGPVFVSEAEGVRNQSRVEALYELYGTEMRSRENLRKRKSTGDPPHLRSLKPMR